MTADLQLQLRRAKVRLSRAAERCLDNAPGAAEEANKAQAEVAALQAVMKAGRAHLCMAPECNVVTLRAYCWKHRAAG